MTGAVVWFTGLSGAGKSTLSQAVGARSRLSRPVEILDGDDVRTHLSKGLGYSRDDRDANVRRIGFVARLLARNGVLVITAAISPYAGVRDEIRTRVEGEGVPFLEIFVNPTLDSLIRRDPKGLYRRALAGEIEHFTGISDPYEPPVRPELVIETDKEAVDVSVQRVCGLLAERGLVVSA